MNRGRICLSGERENVLFLKSPLRLHGPCHHSWEDCQQTEKAGLCLYHLEGTQSCPVLQAKQDQGQLGLGWTICLRSLVWTWLLVLPASPQQDENKTGEDQESGDGSVHLNAHLLSAVKLVFFKKLFLSFFKLFLFLKQSYFTGLNVKLVFKGI